MTFGLHLAIEEAEVIVSAEVKADERELRVVDRLPFIIARQIGILYEKPVASRRTHELARDRELMQLRPTPKLQSLVADA